MKRFLALCLLFCLIPLAAPAEETVTLHVSEWEYVMLANRLDAFSAQYPHIKVEAASDAANSIEEDIISGAGVDIYTVSAAGIYEQIVSKGYALPLASADLLAKGQRLIPALQDICFRDGVLYALPSQLTLNHWTLDETGWLNVGYTLDEIPTTLQEFLTLYEDWIDRCGDFSDTYYFEGGTLEYLTGVLVRQYIAGHENKETAVTFDDHFRQALRMLEEARPLFEADRERMEALMNSGGYVWPLIFNYAIGFGYEGLDAHEARPLMIPALNEDVPPFTEGEAFLYFVSARTKHPEEAQLLLSFMLDQLSGKDEYMIYANMTEPVENAWFLEQLPQYTAELEQVNEKLKNCAAEERQALEERKTQLENNLSPDNERRWEISPRDIAVHQSVAQNIKVPTKSLYLAKDSNCYETLQSLITRFASGSMTAENFVNEMERTCSLAFLEQ